MVRQEDVERVEREKLVLNQARVRLGARIQAPFEAGGLKGCVVRKKAPEKKAVVNKFPAKKSPARGAKK